MMSSPPGPETGSRSLTIAPARIADFEAVWVLIRSVADQLCGTDTSGDSRAKATRDWVAAMPPTLVQSYICDPAFIYLTGHIDRELVGAVAIRDRRHLFHLFVAPACQRRGYGRQLWHAVLAATLAAGGSGNITVNASLGAVPVYQRFGFRLAGPRAERNGIVFVPMVFSADNIAI